MSYESTVLGYSPVGYWRLDETSGTSAADDTGNGHTGTYTIRTSPGYTLAQTSLLAGDSDDSVLLNAGGINVPDASALRITSDLTLILWVNIYDAAATYFLITKCVDNGGSQNAFEWRLDTDGTNLYPRFLQGSGTYVDSTTQILPGVTHMLAVTRSGGAGGTVKHYLDGSPNGSGTLSPTPDPCTGYDVMIGGRNNTGFTAHGYYDEPAIFNTVLSDSDILAIYNAGVTNPNVTISAPSSVATATAPAPTIELGTHVTISAPAASATATAPIPTVSEGSGVIITAATATATASAPSPTISLSVAIQAPSAAAYASALVPQNSPAGIHRLGVTVFSGTEPQRPIATVYATRDRNWLDQFLDVGSGSVKIHKFDQGLKDHPELLEYDSILRFSLDGIDRFSAILEQRDLPPAPQEENAGRWWTLSGRGVLAFMEYASVYPEPGWQHSAVRDRTFGWMAMAFDDSSWTSALQMQQQGNTSGTIINWRNRPEGWPDKTAYWIWSRAMVSNSHPPGRCYFRKHFTLTEKMDVVVWFAGDNNGQLWLDDEKLFDSFGDHSSFYSAQGETRMLEAGTHVLAAVVQNDPSGVSQNPGGLLVSVLQAALPTNVIVHSDSSWLALDYPASVPGMTPGEIFRILVDEAHGSRDPTRYCLEGIGIDFNDDKDSDGVDWPVIPDIAFQVGSTYLDALRVLMEQHVDARMTLDLVLQMYNRGGEGTDLTGSVSLLVGRDFEDLGASGQGRLTNVILSRDQNDQLLETVDTSSLASHRRRETYLELSTAPSAERAGIVADSTFIEYAGPTVQLQGRVALGSGLYTVWKPGDTVLFPNSFDQQVPTTILSVTVSDGPEETGHPQLGVTAAQDDVASS